MLMPRSVGVSGGTLNTHRGSVDSVFTKLFTSALFTYLPMVVCVETSILLTKKSQRSALTSALTNQEIPAMGGFHRLCEVRTSNMVFLAYQAAYQHYLIRF
jgi:hypothetical protein